MKFKSLERIVKALAIALPLVACAAPDQVICGPGIMAMSVDNQTSIVYADGSQYAMRHVEQCAKPKDPSKPYVPVSY